MRRRTLILVTLIVVLVLTFLWLRRPAGEPPQALDVYTVVIPVQDLLPPDGEFSELVNAIQTEVAPESWEENGGRGAISGFPKQGSLIVSQVAPVHTEVARYLTSRRQP